MVNPRIKRLKFMDLDAKYAEYKAAHPMTHLKPERFKEVVRLGATEDHSIRKMSRIMGMDHNLVSMILRESGTRTDKEIDEISKAMKGHSIERVFGGELLDATKERLDGTRSREEIAREVGVCPSTVTRVRRKHGGEFKGLGAKSQKAVDLLKLRRPEKNGEKGLPRHSIRRVAEMAEVSERTASRLSRNHTDRTDEENEALRIENISQKLKGKRASPALLRARELITLSVLGAQDIHAEMREADARAEETRSDGTYKALLSKAKREVGLKKLHWKTKDREDAARRELFAFYRRARIKKLPFTLEGLKKGKLKHIPGELPEKEYAKWLMKGHQGIEFDPHEVLEFLQWEKTPQNVRTMIRWRNEGPRMVAKREKTPKRTGMPKTVEEVERAIDLVKRAEVHREGTREALLARLRRRRKELEGTVG